MIPLLIEICLCLIAKLCFSYFLQLFIKKSNQLTAWLVSIVIIITWAMWQTLGSISSKVKLVDWSSIQPPSYWILLELKVINPWLIMQIAFKDTNIDRNYSKSSNLQLSKQLPNWQAHSNSPRCNFVSDENYFQFEWHSVQLYAK